MATRSGATVALRHVGPAPFVAGAALIAALLSAACSAGSSPAPVASAASSAPSGGPGGGTAASPVTAGAAASGSITLYTSVTQATVDAVVQGFSAAHPGVSVDVFRAATGELAGRIAAELRDGRIRGDILWLTDPLSIEAYAEQGLLLPWQPAGAAGLDAAIRTDTFWATRFLNVVMVRGTSVTPGPSAWHDLADPAYHDAVALPDPGFAGSALGALAYFDGAPGFGTAFLQALKANGATQVQAPDDVTTGVAEGRFKAGITLDSSARTAIAKGSPVQLAWPSDGAIAIYSPIAVVGATANAPAAEAFVEFALSDAGQRAIAATGWEPVRAGAGGPPIGGSQVFPDWKAAFGRQQQLLTQYRAIFGG